MKGKVLLSFDVEEFDIPLEYGHAIEPAEQLQIGRMGLDAITPLLDLHEVPATMFTTANFALHFPETIKQLALHHEIASHTFYHSSFEMGDLLRSKQTLEQVSGQLVTGLRMPRMKKIDIDQVVEAGYSYDSSINPTWLPGKYNNLGKPRLLFKEKGIIRIPASVSPVLRLPLFWLAFKNYPYTFFLKLCLRCLKSDGYICLYFHPWEFTDINNYGLPGYVKKLHGIPLLERLDRLIKDLKKEYEFTGIQHFLDRKNSKTLIG